ncbi:MAG TPA: hypothetical protein VGH90_06020, partial [Chthoniobacteraceae bacterium]
MTLFLGVLTGAAETKLATDLKGSDLDPATFAFWLAGKEAPLTGVEGGPAAAMWTKEPLREWRG